MKRVATIEGKSLVFNAAFVLVNLTGLAFLVFANVNTAPDSYWLFTFLGLGLMLLSIAGIIIFKGRLMIASVARILVGGLFIVSGLVKANDPIGFSYKLEEYFQDGALAYRIKELFGAPSFSLEFLMDSALALSIIICIAEIVLGVMTLIGGKIKLVSYLLLAMMLFFTFLTWHTADCNPKTKFLDRDTYAMSSPKAKAKIAEAKKEKVSIHSQTSSEVIVDEMKSPQCVSDCGCFGDALKGSVGRSLTPNESLWKDLILLYFVAWIFLAQWIIRPNTIRENLIFTVSSSIVIVFFSWVFGWYFPVLFALIAILGALWIRRTGGKLIGNHWGSALFVAFLSLIVVVFVLRYAPMKDYRPYAIGSNLYEKLHDEVPGVFNKILVYKNKKTGEKRTYLDSSDEYTASTIWEKKNWEFDKWDEEVVRATIKSTLDEFDPFIKVKYLSDNELKLDFVKALITTTKVKRIRVKALQDEVMSAVLINEFDLESYPAEEYQIIDTVESNEIGVDDIFINEALLKEKQAVVLVSSDLTNANWNEMDRIKAIAAKCERANVPFLVIASASRKEIDAFRKDHAFNCAVFSMDQIELKIISRSNPALLVLENGVVKEKYSHRMIPTGDRFKELHL